MRRLYTFRRLNTETGILALKMKRMHPSVLPIYRFLTLLFLFVRVLPVISITEMRELVHEQSERADRREAAQLARDGGD